MPDFKDRMIEAYERGWCSYEGSYDFVREQDAEAADLARKREKEDAVDLHDPRGPRLHSVHVESEKWAERHPEEVEYAKRETIDEREGK